MPIRLKSVHPVAGFCARNTRPGEIGPILVKATVTSDDPMFHVYMDQLERMYLGATRIIPNAVLTFLVVIHADQSADLYVNNDVLVHLEARAKRTIQAGEMARESDIADVRRLKFPNAPLVSTDSVVYCAKIGWRFALYFDFRGGDGLDLDRMSLELGAMHRRLAFDHVYKALEVGGPFEAMLIDGWFPFVEAIPVEFQALAAAYIDRFDFDARVARVLDAFPAERIRRIADRWYANPVFATKKKLLDAGVSAYLQRNDDGYIACIKTLGTEIEGLLRAQRTADTGKPATEKSPVLIKHVVDKEIAKSESAMSLLLPAPFRRYLTEVVFRSFNLATGDLVMSRNSAGHGVAKAEDYTRVRALQMILTVDQLYFFS